MAAAGKVFESPLFYPLDAKVPAFLPPDTVALCGKCQPLLKPGYELNRSGYLQMSFHTDSVTHSFKVVR